MCKQFKSHFIFLSLCFLCVKGKPSQTKPKQTKPNQNNHSSLIYIHTSVTRECWFGQVVTPFILITLRAGTSNLALELDLAQVLVLELAQVLARSSPELELDQVLARTSPGLELAQAQNSHSHSNTSETVRDVSEQCYMELVEPFNEYINKAQQCEK